MEVSSANLAAALRRVEHGIVFDVGHLEQIGVKVNCHTSKGRNMEPRMIHSFDSVTLFRCSIMLRA